MFPNFLRDRHPFVNAFGGYRGQAIVKPFVARILIAGLWTAFLGAQQPEALVKGVGENAAGLAGAALTPGEAAKFGLALLHDQATVTIPEWGAGREGLERRAQLLAATHLAGSVIEYEVARLRGSSEGYERCRCKGFPRRSRHAVVSEFVERRANGSLAQPVARLAGVYVPVVVTLPLLPQGYGVGNMQYRANMTLIADAAFNVLKEFWPEIKRTLLFRRTTSP
jgi:hypothetical protein